MVFFKMHEEILTEAAIHTIRFPLYLKGIHHSAS
ncbi:hypothetical protein B0I27_10753 [Arcticibacter pallidicorallinus]|uniref:Uncharacterized protein n=1 Tax=Arcticibacter pallidicorallinus TaxID=1259464 RepID=A0A2T0U0V0_9SPHI|nr:hypothetical protein B0I27_10753 [Arcticibacter pallidicorallinus]